MKLAKLIIVTPLMVAACAVNQTPSTRIEGQSPIAPVALPEERQISEVTLEKEHLLVQNSKGESLFTAENVKAVDSSKTYIAIQYLDGKKELRDAKNTVLVQAGSHAILTVKDTFAAVIEGNKRMLFHYLKVDPIYVTENGGNLDISNSFAAVQESGKAGWIYGANGEVLLKLQTPSRIWVSDTFMAYLALNVGALYHVSGQKISETKVGETYLLSKTNAVQVTTGDKAVVYDENGVALMQVEGGFQFNLKEDLLTYTVRRTNETKSVGLTSPYQNKSASKIETK